MGNHMVKSLLANEIVRVAFAFAWTRCARGNRGHYVKIHATLLQGCNYCVFSSPGGCREHEKQSLFARGLRGRFLLRLDQFGFKMHMYLPGIFKCKRGLAYEQTICVVLSLLSEHNKVEEIVPYKPLVGSL